MKAMILAAGRGERLRPVTDRLPKPLLEVGGRPLLAWHLERLAAARIREVIINVSHFADLIVERIGDGAAFGLAIVYSRESQPLETAGGIAQARARLGEAPFLLVNGDVYCECDFTRLRSRRLGPRLAHLMLVPNPAHRPQGDFSLEAGSVGNGAGARYTYAGIAVMSPAMVDGIEPGAKAPLGPLLRTAAGSGRLGGELYQGVWQDVGTVERLAALDDLLAARHGAQR
ncbi:MAG: N-acetylmuramate alpha-1-phosphate uridylyltransferase MurU [Burkholderiales bacterium]